jgi:hypothetical protein
MAASQHLLQSNSLLAGGLPCEHCHRAGAALPTTCRLVHNKSTPPGQENASHTSHRGGTRIVPSDWWQQAQRGQAADSSWQTPW